MFLTRHRPFNLKVEAMVVLWENNPVRRKAKNILIPKKTTAPGLHPFKLNGSSFTMRWSIENPIATHLFVSLPSVCIATSNSTDCSDGIHVTSAVQSVGSSHC